MKKNNKSCKINVKIKGNDNQVVTNSNNTEFIQSEGAKLSQHWLQIIYWIVGIVFAMIGIYKFFIE